MDDIGIPPSSVEMLDDYPEDCKCENCRQEDDILEYYDNLIQGPSGWLCGECIAIAEMEL